MKTKKVSRNKDNPSINFCTTGNFLNLSRVKFIPMDKQKPIKKTEHLNKKNSYSNISEFQITKNDEIAKKDEIIKKLREKIIYLENKIKILEKGKIKIKSRNTSLNNTLIFKTDKTKKIYLRTQNIYNAKLIPLDKELLKAQLNKKKKNLVEFLDVKKIIQKNKNHSYYNSETKLIKNDKNINNKTINNSLSNICTRNSSGKNSALKPKKTIKLNNINKFHNILYLMSSNLTTQNDKKSCSRDEKKINRKINKINAIPKKLRTNQNISPKIMLCSTNYSNNISSSFKEETTLKKNTSILNNENNKNNSINYYYSINKNNSFNEIKIKLESIKNRTKNLLDLFSLINMDKKINNNKNNNKTNYNSNNKDINQKNTKNKNYSNYFKISKLEKIKEKKK